MSIRTPSGEPQQTETPLRRPADAATDESRQAPPTQTVRIQVEPVRHQPEPGQAQYPTPHGAPYPGPGATPSRTGPSPWLWVVFAVLGLVVAVVAAAVLVGAIHGVTGAVQQQTGVLAGQVRALNQIDRDLRTLIQTIQQAVQAILSRMPGG
ncbi:MAG TPA: hypothetical protein VNM16_13125 [Bacillota bacterium]|nr:hypothetical protein [Bacillota bacterium]